MDQELTHHGIRGMKWGRRRYQNPDGSLTPAGRKRYGVEAGNQRSSAQLARNQATKASSPKPISKKKSPDDDIPEENRYLTKKARSMTDAEIDKAIARLQKEETFKRLSPEEKERAQKAVNDMSYRKKSLNEMSNEDIQRALDRANLERQYRQAYPEQVSAGKKFIRSLANDVIAPAAKSAGKDFLEKALKKLGDKYLKDAPDPNSLEGLENTKKKLGLKSDIQDLKDKLTGKKKDDRTDAEKERDEWKLKSEIKKYKDEYEGKTKKDDKPKTAEERRKERDLEEYLWKNDPQFRKDNPDWGERHTNEGAEAASRKTREAAKSFVDNIVKQTANQFLLPEADKQANKTFNNSQKKAEKAEADRIKKMRDEFKSKINDNRWKASVNDDFFEILDPEPKAKSTSDNTKSRTLDDIIFDQPGSGTYRDKSSSTYKSGKSFVNQFLGLPAATGLVRREDD